MTAWYGWALPAYTAFKDKGTGTGTFEEGRGLVWARELAEDELLRRQAGPHGRQRWPLTVDMIADRLGEQDLGAEGLSRRQVDKAIGAARLHLFGTLSDAGIRARKRRAEELGRRPPNRCRECGRLLPRRPRHRRYCDEHRTVAARVRRHRAQEAPRA